MLINKRIVSYTLFASLICVNSYSAGTENNQNRLMPTPFSEIFLSTEYPGTALGVPDTSMIQPMNQDLWNRYPELQKMNLRIYGWVDPSYNISSSNNSNVPLAYTIVPNKIVLDQFVLRAERSPNTVQTQHVDFGFHLSNILGIDYRYTISQGIFSGQIYQDNNLYGDDPIEFNGQIYIPNIAEGMLITIGRYFSPADVESIFAPISNFLTHSLTTTYNSYTMTGINGVVQLNKQLNILLGLHSASDTAPWAPGAHPTFQFLTRWVSKDNNNSLIGGIVSLNDGQFTANHDNLQQMSMTWTHRFNENFKNSSEVDYIYQFNAAKGGSCISGPIESYGGGGGGCGPIIPGLSNAVSFVNISSLKLFEKNLLSLRFDFLNDPQGQRTGYATPYLDVTLGLSHDINSYIKIRPEIRFDQAFKANAYNNGTRKEQTTFNVDTIFLI